MAFSLQHVSKSFSNQSVLDDVNLAVNNQEVVALIGANGAGKTTLLQLLVGELQPDSGVVQVNGSIGYVPQHMEVLGQTNKTIVQSFSAALPVWQIEYALGRVGLNDIPINTAISTLSGGQKTRLAFAIVLANDSEPSLLLLDEPTNNLDAKGLQWLAEFVRQFSGAILLVSHDRAFINQVATRTVELRNGRLKQYGGNYDFYRQQQALEQAAEQARYQEHIDERNRLTKALREQREKGKHTHEHMKQWRDHDTSQRDFFKNRVTNKFGQQARQIEKRLDQLGDIERLESAKDYKVNLGGSVVGDKLVLRLQDVCKSFGKPVLDTVELEIRGSQRIQVRGPNGSGKTTLLTIAAGRLGPDQGDRHLGAGVTVGYFSQDVDGLDHNQTGLQNLLLTEAHTTDIFREARSLGLTKDDLHKKINQLSRGQQAKLGFAKLLLAKHQLLVLDEPTNHLDLPTREHIEAALKYYKGALLFASHDDYFANLLTPDTYLDLGDTNV